MKTMEDLRRLWRNFGNILVDENDCTTSSWEGFPKGTCRFDIWLWFEDQNMEFSIAKQLYGKG